MNYKKGKRKHCRSETKALHNGTKVSTLTRAEKKKKKKQLITRGCFTLGALKEMERAARRGRTSHHYLCVHTRNLLLQSAAAAVSNLAVPLQHQQGLDRPFSLIVP